MDLQLEGKVVFISGGSRGIGLACARQFAREGARVAIAGRTAETLQTALLTLRKDGLDAHVECVDLGEPALLKDAIGRIERALGLIDVLVNCAGAASHHSPGSVDPERWETGIRAKYLPTVHAMDAVVPGMVARGGGVVVNVAGLGGKIADPMHMAGGAANAAVCLVSAAMARAWGPQGVRVNVINPGPTQTDRVTNALRVRSDATGRSVEEIRRERESSIPLRRYGHPDDVAALAVFLASARASYITGATVAVDGGVSSLP